MGLGFCFYGVYVYFIFFGCFVFSLRFGDSSGVLWFFRGFVCFYYQGFAGFVWVGFLSGYLFLFSDLFVVFSVIL